MRVCQYAGKHTWEESGYCKYCGIRDDGVTDEPPAVVAVHAVTLYQAVCHSCGWESALVPRSNDAHMGADAHECREPRPG